MEKLMLPEQLKSWKVGEPVADAGNYPAYNVVKTDEYGAETEGVLTYVCFEGTTTTAITSIWSTKKRRLSSLSSSCAA